ncbi:MAG TPA: isoprenylcysteine carboxylmethyltransferase family protein [Bacteroidota bacterium]
MNSELTSDFRHTLFRYRSYTPIPFLLVMLAFAQPTMETALVGGVVALLGESLRFWGVAYAGSLTRVTGSVGAPAVIVSGPFAIVRNPLYVGNMMLYVGIGIVSNALFPWLASATVVYFLVQYSLIVSLEEQFLEKEFGAGYLEYKKNVPRFFPRLLPYETPAQTGQKPNWTEAVRSERRTLQAILLVSIALLVRGSAW